MDLDVSIRRKHLPVAVFSEHSHMFNQWGDHRITKGIERQKGAVRGILRTLSYFTVTSLNAVLLGPKSQDQNPRVPPHFLFSLNTFFFFLAASTVLIPPSAGFFGKSLWLLTLTYSLSLLWVLLPCPPPHHRLLSNRGGMHTRSFLRWPYNLNHPKVPIIHLWR